MTTAAVVLAAGAGRRYAGPGHKLLAEAGGTPIVALAVSAATAAGLDEVIVVQGAVEVAGVVGVGVTVVTNARWASGQASSLRCGIETAADHGHTAVVVGLGDQPTVAAEAWRRVSAATSTPIAVATYAGRRGHPVRLASPVWPLLPLDGDTGARTVMAEQPHLVTEVACPGDPFDVDTVEDLSRWS